MRSFPSKSLLCLLTSVTVALLTCPQNVLAESITAEYPATYSLQPDSTDYTIRMSLTGTINPSNPSLVTFQGRFSRYRLGVWGYGYTGWTATGTRSGDTITCNFNNSSSSHLDGTVSIGSFTLTRQPQTNQWVGTISFEIWVWWDGPYPRRLEFTSGGPVVFPNLQSQRFTWWENKITDWKANLLPLTASIRALEKDYVSGAASYRVLYRNFPPVFDKVYKIKLDPTGKRGIILKRGSGRAALIDLNDAFLTFTKVYSKVKLGGKALTEIVKSGTLKTETMVKIGLTVYDIPKDKLTAIAYIDKLAIRFGSAYRPLRKVYRDQVNYSSDRSKAIKAMTLMNTNLLRIRDFGIKARNGIRSEGEDLAAEIEADTLLTAEEKSSLKFALGLVVLDLTN